MRTGSDGACATCEARTRTPYCGLGGARLLRHAAERVIHVYQRGQFLFHAGTPALALHVVRSGRIKVASTLHSGRELVLRLAGPGDVLGYRPVLAGEPYRASAEALEDASVCIFPAGCVREALQADPGLAQELLAQLARELGRTEDRMLELAHQPVRQRVAHLLLALAGARPGAGAGPRDPSRKDMARMVGTTPETLSRVLREFARRELVAVTRERVRVRDAAALRRAAGVRAPAT